MGKKTVIIDIDDIEQLILLLVLLGLLKEKKK
jgi:hypothetical protein